MLGSVEGIEVDKRGSLYSGRGWGWLFGSNATDTMLEMATGEKTVSGIRRAELTTAGNKLLYQNKKKTVYRSSAHSFSRLI